MLTRLRYSSNLSSYRSSVHYRYNRPGRTEDCHNIIPEGVTDGNGGEFKNKDYYGADYDKNFEEAKELLASIGLLDESTGQVRQTVEFSYLVNNSESNVKIGEAIQADLSKVRYQLKG